MICCYCACLCQRVKSCPVEEDVLALLMHLRHLVRLKLMLRKLKTSQVCSVNLFCFMILSFSCWLKLFVYITLQLLLWAMLFVIFPAVNSEFVLAWYWRWMPCVILQLQCIIPNVRENKCICHLCLKWLKTVYYHSEAPFVFMLILMHLGN